MNKLLFRRFCVLASLMALSVATPAIIDETKINISKAVGTPTLSVRYSGANAALIELRVNGESFGTRTLSEATSSGETTFTLDVKALKVGDNEVEIRLFDKSGKLLGTQKTIVTAEDTQPTVFLDAPKTGATLTGPVEINVGFGRELKSAYVTFFIDDQFRSMTNFPPYNLVWDTTRDANGWHEIEAWAVDELGETFKTRKIRVFVNNPGGRTNRNLPANSKPVAMKPPALAKAVGTAASNPVVGPLGPEAEARSIETAAASVMTGNPVAVAPTVAAWIIENPVAAIPSAATSSLKPVPLPKSVSSGMRILTPTGGRMVAPAVLEIAIHPSVTAIPAQSAELRITSTPMASLVEREWPSPAPKVEPVATVVKPVPPVEAAVTAAPEAIEHPVVAAEAPKPAPVVHDLPPVEIPADMEPLPQPSRAVATTVRIAKGVRLPVGTTLRMYYNSREIMFDVIPSVTDGVPITPLRHLIEGAGGSVYWSSEEQAVLANAEDREILVRIGERVARVNKLPVEMEIAPFLQSGRTIVPLSFISDALSVEIEYDVETGHVLITKK